MPFVPTDDPSTGEATETIAALQARMDAAAAALDFEEARRLRDRINLLRGGAAPAAAAAADASGLTRQRPGAMGLGTSRQQVSPPPGWTPPPKPDPMTRGRKPRPTQVNEAAGNVGAAATLIARSKE